MKAPVRTPSALWRRYLSTSCVVGLLLGPAPLAQTAPTVVFDSHRVEVSNLTPSASVAWFALCYERPGWTTGVIRRSGVTEASQDGSLTVELERAVPLRSIWLVADLSTGEYTLATPPAMPLRPIDAAHVAVQAEREGELQLDLQGFSLVDLVIVRPDVGAWAGIIGDGGDSDQDGESNGTILVSLGGLHTVGDSPQDLEWLLAGDIIVVYDTRNLRVVALAWGTGKDGREG